MAIFTGAQIRTATSLVAARDMIRQNLVVDDVWLVRGLLALFARQTSDEQSGDHTNHENARGFNSADAFILSRFAKQVQAWQDTPVAERRYNSPLSPRQLEITRTKLRKYSMQLARIARPQDAAQLVVEEPAVA